jgi:hypothetical protein
MEKKCFNECFIDVKLQKKLERQQNLPSYMIEDAG